ncbi:hypothetical protein BUALT_Bualt14G0112400 [Buddleja alternifolia]|uniref:Coatomer subunit beta n=1 Tax=Buddleja alternifolia TaxID=168488 RepID=A0AAV6WI25_9LAMI|nr:hypothetical protein BUALT_Bualt14G0112400 [Buddleja alternifolia]
MEKSCSFLVHFDKGTPALANEIKEALERNDVPAKIDATKNAIMLLLNGETVPPQLFNTIVKYVLPSEDHTIQKLLLLYLEIIDYKTDGEGLNVLPAETISICQNLRNNLQHPNEYIRGVTLRFLCRLNETEFIKPLFLSIISNLKHRHPYVRRNAILAVISIFHRRVPQGERHLETMERFVSSEQDASAKRNAFLMLSNCAQDDRAVNYILSNVDRVSDWGELLQKVVLEMIQKVYRKNKAKRGKYINNIISILNASPSASVVYECAGTLVSLTCAPTAIRVAANTYCQLLLSQSDNNVKLILLDRLNELIESSMSHRDIMVEMIMEILKGGLSSPNLDAQRKTLDITLELITPGNVNEVVFTLKMEFMKTQSEKSNKEEAADSSKKKQQATSITVSSRKPAILADGTYATQSAASETASSPAAVVQGSLNLRSLLLTGDDFFLGAVVACTRLAKLVLRLEEVQPSKDCCVTHEMLLGRSDLSLALRGFSKCFPINSYVKLKLKQRLSISDSQLDDLIDFYHLKSRKVKNCICHLLYIFCEHLDVALSSDLVKQADKSKHQGVPTETGVIFGNVVYEISNVLEQTVVVLNDIHIDIMDYISPSVCSDTAFRTMGAEFETRSAVEGEYGFLAANLYAKSVFGEDALVNASVEKQADGKAYLVSNGKFKSIEHRVIANLIGSRSFAAYFFSGPVNGVKIIGLIEELISEENPAIYREVMLSEYVVKLLTTALNNYRALGYYKSTPIGCAMLKSYFPILGFPPPSPLFQFLEFLQLQTVVLPIVMGFDALIVVVDCCYACLDSSNSVKPEVSSVLFFSP